MVTDTRQTVSRGRPRAFDAERGVEIAARLFRASGYDAVGVAELAKAIGISAPSLYAAYGSKCGLLRRALALYGNAEGGFIAETLAEEGPVADIVARLFARAAARFTADHGAAGCLVIECTRNTSDPAAREMTVAALEASRAAVAERIALEAPERAGDLAEFVLVGLSGLSAEARAGAAPEGLAASARILAGGFRAELDARPGS